MKKLVVLLFAFAMNSGISFANNIDDKGKEEVKKMRTQIVNLLGNYNSEKDSKAEITFMLNRKNEIVILSVISSDGEIESFVKRKLNYKKVGKTTGQVMRIYKLPIKIVKA